MLAIAAFFDYEIWQMDIKPVFLNGNIEEELYMVKPKGFVDPKDADKVCKLQQSIYRLKQASQSWNLHFDQRVWICQNLWRNLYLQESEWELCNISNIICG
jgi:hypothetical protein